MEKIERDQSLEILRRAEEYQKLYDQYDEDDDPTCDACEEKIYFKSRISEYGLHVEMPEILDHHSHIEHPLTLTKISHGDFQLDGNHSSFVYHCEETDCSKFLLCIQCSIKSFKDLDDSEKKRFKFNHFGHKHSLHPRYFYKAKGICMCIACLQPIYGLAYRCRKNCEFFIHYSCALVPREVQHYCHPEHALNLLTEPPYDSKEFRCNACRMVCGGYTYHCAQCQYNLDIKCAVQKPTVKHDRHEHLLLPFTEIGLDVQCFACNMPCKEDLYRCVVCDFNIHFGCVSLPSSVQHRRDDHPLVLTPKYLGDDTGTGEYYCDVCEQPRNPDRGVYVCEQCVFVAHIECVIPNSKAKVNPEFEESQAASTTITSEDETKKGIIATKVEYAKLDLEIGKLHLEVQELKSKFNVEMEKITAKLKALEDQHLQYVAATSGIKCNKK